MEDLPGRILTACRTELCGLYPGLNGAFACLPQRPGARMGTDGAFLYVPDAIVRLGRVRPAAVLGLLVIYCLKDARVTAYYGLPELISLACVVAVHLWKRNMVLSLIAGTVLHMVLVQWCFV